MSTASFQGSATLESRKDREIALVNARLTSAPTDLVTIARDLGVNVFVADLSSNVSGILRKDQRHGGSSGYVILANEKHPPNRQRFTVAHEIGHFILHRADDVPEITDDEFYRALSGPLETEANQFAADILMPWEIINALMKDGYNDLSTLAEKLRVSRQALSIRLGVPYDESWN